MNINLEIALLRQGISPTVIAQLRKESDFRTNREHPIAKVERLQISNQARRKARKRADQKAGPILYFKGLLKHMLIEAHPSQTSKR